MPIPTPCLLLVAAPSEAEAVARAAPTPIAAPIADSQSVPLTPDGRFLLARSGVGKVNAAAAALLLTQVPGPTPRPACILNLGIGGALPVPNSAPLAIGTLVLGATSLYADEGVQTPDRFLDIAEVGFPPGGNPEPAGFRGSRIAGDAALLESCRDVLVRAGLQPVTADIATVSTCSGTDTLARAVAERTRAAVEAMEGAAIAHALGRAPGPRVPFCEIRIVSNSTGDRARQVWDIRGAFARLSEVAAALIGSHAHR